MNPLSILRQFIKGLTVETGPEQIAGGIALGFLIGLLPKANLTAQLLLILLMALRVNIPMALMAMLGMTLLNPLTDKLTDPAGYYVLANPALHPLWTKLYNAPVIPWTGFNNTALMGGLLLGLVFLFPVYLAGRKFGVYYNERFKEKITGSKFVKTLKASWLLDWYFKEN